MLTMWFLLFWKGFRRYFLGSRGFAYTLFLCVGGVGLLLRSTRVLFSDDTPRNNLTVSILTTVFIVGLVEVASKTLDILREGFKSPTFREFFGDGAFDNEGFKTVFLQATPPPFPPSEYHGDAVNLLMPIIPEAAKNTYPKGVKNVIPFADLQGVLDIDREFRKYGAELRIVLDNYKYEPQSGDNPDKEWPLPEKGCIAIGLGFNNVTVNLMERTGKQLYEVHYHKTGDNKDSDDVTIQGDTGAMGRRNDYALIARVLIETVKGPVPYIVCAGHTATATAEACKFLASHWLEIAGKYATEDHKKPRLMSQSSMAVFLRFTRDEENHVSNVKLGDAHFYPDPHDKATD